MCFLSSLGSVHTCEDNCLVIQNAIKDLLFGLLIFSPHYPPFLFLFFYFLFLSKRYQSVLEAYYYRFSEASESVSIQKLSRCLSKSGRVASIISWPWVRRRCNIDDESISFPLFCVRDVMWTASLEHEYVSSRHEMGGLETPPDCGRPETEDPGWR